MTEFQRVRIEEIEIDEGGPVTVVHFCEHRISDLLEIEKLGQELYQLVEQNARRKLVFDFSGVEFFSSAAIGKLISLHGKLKVRGGLMKLCNLRPEIFEVFRVCRLNRVFDIRQDKADAMRSFED
jgi:anti-sigma B factor antagonist